MREAKAANLVRQYCPLPLAFLTKETARDYIPYSHLCWRKGFFGGGLCMCVSELGGLHCDLEKIYSE